MKDSTLTRISNAYLNMLMFGIGVFAGAALVIAAYFAVIEVRGVREQAQACEVSEATGLLMAAAERMNQDRARLNADCVCPQDGQ